MKGYKVFDKDWTCRGFKYEVGETYKHDGELELCGSGFHFCEKIADCFNYYDFDPENKIAEIKALGKVESGNDKSVTDNIKIVREVSWQEMLKLANTGKGNTGIRNSGNRNSGNRNSGDRNSGNRNSGYGNSGNRNSGYSNSGYGNSGYSNSGYGNSGYRNSGYGNSGYGNSGDRNSGYSNSGYGNSGNGNSGDRNSGYGNSGDSNSGNRNSGDRCTGDFNISDNETGCFCTEQHKIRIFDIETYMTLDQWRNSKACRLLRRINYIPCEWVWEDAMYEEEKESHPSYKTTGGYLKKNDLSKVNQEWWEKLTDDEKQIIKDIPNFDSEKFKMIMGIEV